jgi:hypothetical protein
LYSSFYSIRTIKWKRLSWKEQIALIGEKKSDEYDALFRNPKRTYPHGCPGYNIEMLLKESKN